MAGEEIKIITADGTVPARVFGPKGTPGIVLYMDIFGPREALWEMAERIGSWGYRVLVPDLFYRIGAYGPFDAATAFQDEAKKKELFALKNATPPSLVAEDTGAFLDALVAHGATAPFGAVGYCMGGPCALVAAAAYPVRIVVAASLHGGNLASEDEDSPHHLADRMKALIYVGTAEDDHSFPPEQSGRLALALRTAKTDHIIENYPGTTHGWCVADHGAYHRDGAERHWRRLAQLFAEKLYPEG
ncbi:dienelactone hydrolase family protein [Acidimangrovimonas sediminis]|uniref:dienelactone hydrolase family protein n=1 Tax=Acidimangrovimonas sediminis TaxID=2056283 RepID=UPI000C7F87A8|nr:dienelactone hydrolase family protein [Acidimangrovimonas sediminis]